MPDKTNTRSISESENPAIESPTPKVTRPGTNRDWWPNQPDLSVLHQPSSAANPLGEDFDYAKRSSGWASPPSNAIWTAS